MKKKFKIQLTQLTIFIFTLILIPKIIFGEDIPSSCRINWEQAGLLSSPTTANRVFVISRGGNYDSKIAAAIDSARQYPTVVSIIFLPGGVYELSSEIELNENNRNIIFQGTGSAATILESIIQKMIFQFQH